MTRQLPGKVLVGLAVLLSAAVAESRLRTRPVRSPLRPALAVIVAVDGLSWERLSFYRPWYVAGLKRLLDEGRLETACRYRHINTETGPGHASLATGVPPRLHGIVTNMWYERGPDGAMRSTHCTDEVGPDGTVLRGADHLRVPTLGDRLRATYPGSRVVSLSAKDRSAIFLAGRDRQHTVYWYDKTAGTFVTSSRYEPPATSKDVVAHFNGPRRGRSPGTLRSRVDAARGIGRVGSARVRPPCRLPACSTSSFRRTVSGGITRS